MIGARFMVTQSKGRNTLGNKMQRNSSRRRLFAFRKRSLPFLTVDGTTGNHAFSHDRCSIFSGFKYNEANNTILNSPRKNDVESQDEFTLKVMERARVTILTGGHLVQTPQIPSGFKDKNSRALVVSWVFCFTQVLYK